jgi:hypothetical protein
MNLNQRHLGVALLAAAASTIGIAFVAGCLYPFLLSLWQVSSATAAHSGHDDWEFTTLLEFGFITAMVALPAVFVLTLGVGYPLFRSWIRHEYSNLSVYVGGGIIMSAVAALVISVAHVLAGFLVRSDLIFGLLLIAVSGPIAGAVVWFVLRRSSAMET